jgi:hypothetical protein
MAAFTTHLSLGQVAYGVQSTSYRPDFRVVRMTVGQIRVTETLPSARPGYDSDPLFKEEYMCVETGVGSGNIWQYGKNIFATEADAKAAVIVHEQRAYEQRKAHDEREAERRAQVEASERAQMLRLAEKYGIAEVMSKAG